MPPRAKALIHRNVPGERVFDFLSALEAAWERNAPLASYGKRQRFVATCADLARDFLQTNVNLKSVEKHYRALKTRVLDAMGTAKTAKCGGVKIADYLSTQKFI